MSPTKEKWFPATFPLNPQKEKRLVAKKAHPDELRAVLSFCGPQVPQDAESVGHAGSARDMAASQTDLGHVSNCFLRPNPYFVSRMVEGWTIPKTPNFAMTTCVLTCRILFRRVSE